MAAVGSKRPREEGGVDDAAPSVTLAAEPHVAKLPPGIVQQWQQGKLCDASLRTSDGREFFAHRSVLASASEYFDGLYCSDASEAMVEGAGLGRVQPLQSISGAALESVLSFIYTGKCELESQDALVSMLEAAGFLGMPELCKATESAIVSRISRDSCVASAQLAERHNLTKLAEASAVECCRNITMLGDDCGALSLNFMVKMLRRSNLAVSCEEDVFSVIDTWWQAQAEKPSPSDMCKLLACLRSPLLTGKFIAARVLSAPWMHAAETNEFLIEQLAEDAIQPVLPRCGVEPDNTGVVDDLTYEWAIPRFGRNLAQFRAAGTRQNVYSPYFKIQGYTWRLCLALYPADAEHESERVGIYLHAPIVDRAVRLLTVHATSIRLRNLRSPQSDIVKPLKEGTVITSGSGKGYTTFGVPATLAGFCFGDTLMISVSIGGPITESVHVD